VEGGFYAVFWYLPERFSASSIFNSSNLCPIPVAGFGSSGESGGGGVTVTPDGSILIQIANFIFTIWMLNLLLYKPIRKILTQRKEKVAGLELSIETSTKHAREKDEAFVAGVKEARSRGVEKKNALVQEAAETRLARAMPFNSSASF